MVLETKRLIIREYTEEDIPVLFNILSNPITMSFWPVPFNMNQVENWVQRSINNYKSLGFGRYALILKENGKQIGDCGLMVSEIDGKPENDLGYIIDCSYWKNGYALEAAEACKNYAFKKLSFSRLCANMPYNHEGSRKVAEKIGMKKEKEFYNTRNRNILTYLYSISTSY